MTRDSGRVFVLEYHGKPGYPYSGLKGVTFTDLRSHHSWDAHRAPHGCGNSLRQIAFFNLILNQLIRCFIERFRTEFCFGLSSVDIL